MAKLKKFRSKGPLVKIKDDSVLEHNLREIDPKDKGDRDFAKMLKGIAKSGEVIFNDPRVDDRDFPRAANFFEWCTGKEFLNAEPFPKQLQLGINFFGEFCPKCTDVDFIKDIPFDISLDRIQERATLFHFGRCPRCGYTRAEAIASGELTLYEETAIVSGQRCVTADTRVITTAGMLRIGDIAPSSKPGWHAPQKYKKHKGQIYAFPVIETGHPVKNTKFFVSDPEKVIRVRTRNGQEIKGTFEHPIMTHRGFVKLSELELNDVIPLYVGQDVWAAASCDIDSSDLARLLGFWVSEGTGRHKLVEITNTDSEIRKLCLQELIRIFPYGNAKDTGLRVKMSEGHAVRKFSRLVGGVHRTSAEKIIPESIWTAPRPLVCAFLQALFEGDGGVEGHAVSYCSLSKQLVTGIQLLLANLGIISKVEKFYTWAANGSPNQISKLAWRLWVEGPALLKFHQDIGFFSTRKKEALETVLCHLETKLLDMPFWYEKYPEVVKQEYLDLLAGIDEELSKFHSYSEKRGCFVIDRVRSSSSFFHINSEFGRIYSDNVALSQRRLKSYRETITQHSLWRNLSLELRTRFIAFHEKYLDPKCVWVKIDSIKTLEKERKTYDFYIPDHHRFMAGGFLNHNSGKCSHGNTWVLTPRGYVRLRKIVHEEYSQVVLETGPTASITKYWTKRNDKMQRLHFSNGSTLQVTDHHPIMTVNGYTPARKLKVGETAFPWHVGQDAFTPAESLVHCRNSWPAPVHVAATLNLEKIGGRNYEGAAYQTGQLIGRHIFNKVELEWIYSNPEKPLFKRELADWLMVAPKSFLSGMFRALFFEKSFDFGSSVHFPHPAFRILQQLQLLLANYGVFSHIDNKTNRLIVTGRMALRLARRCDAFQDAKVYLNKQQYINQEKAAWYDIYPLDTRNYIHKLFIRFLQVIGPKINSMKVETGLNWNQEVVYKYLKLLEQETTRDNLRWVLTNHIFPLKIFFDMECAMIVQNLVRLLDMDTTWVKLINRSKGGTTTPYDIEVKDRHRFLANGLVVHNSVSVTQLASYTTHRFMMLQNPSKYFGQLDGTIFHGNAVAPTYGQAKDAIWDPFFEILTESPWFSRYNEFLKQRGNEIGEELFRVRDTYAYYRHRGLSLGPSAASKRNLRGRLRFWGAVDELGWFSDSTENVNISGLEIHKALARSLQTLRSSTRRLIEQGVFDSPQSGMFNISSPSDINDPIMTLYNRSLKPGSKIYGLHTATWEFNPHIRKEDITEFVDDPVGAMRDFGAQPPMSAQAFISGIKHFAAVISKEHSNAAQVVQFRNKTISKIRTTGYLNWKWHEDKVGKLLTIDPGSTSNSFAFSVSHIDPEHGIVFDLFGEIIPHPKYEVDFTGVTDNILANIIQKMGVRIIAGDRWQNKKLMQDLESAFGISYIEHRCKYGDFITWKEGFFNAEFILPRPEMPLKEIIAITESDYRKAFMGKPISHLIYQCLTVQDIPGKTVEKGEGLTDDLFRTMILAFNLLHDPEVAAALIGHVQHNTGGLVAKASHSYTDVVVDPSLPVAVARGRDLAAPSLTNDPNSTVGVGARGSFRRPVNT